MPRKTALKTIRSAVATTEPRSQPRLRQPLQIKGQREIRNEGDRQTETGTVGNLSMAWTLSLSRAEAAVDSAGRTRWSADGSGSRKEGESNRPFQKRNTIL